MIYVPIMLFIIKLMFKSIKLYNIAKKLIKSSKLISFIRLILETINDALKINTIDLFRFYIRKYVNNEKIKEKN